MRIVLHGIEPWRHDLAGCLHADVATLVSYAGLDPLEVLGSSWQFYYKRGDYRSEEYYFPCRDGESLLSSLAPYHSISSRWRWPDTPEQGWSDVRAQVAAGTPVAVAVDNFELPFRPAYTDVHSNHLVIVYGFDDERGTAQVLDAIPPYFNGELPIEVLTAARNSGNRAAHDRDMFFANNPIGNRWLELDVTPPVDHLQPENYLRRNLEGFDTDSAPEAFVGRRGLRDFLAEQEARLAAGESIADELFVVAGVALAGTAIHADWLAAVGRPGWPELARQVSTVAAHWTAIRILAALTRTGGVGVDRLRLRHRRLLAELDSTLAATETLLTAAEAA